MVPKELQAQDIRFALPHLLLGPNSWLNFGDRLSGIPTHRLVVDLFINHWQLGHLAKSDESFSNRSTSFAAFLEGNVGCISNLKSLRSNIYSRVAFKLPCYIYTFSRIHQPLLAFHPLDQHLVIAPKVEAPTGVFRQVLHAKGVDPKAWGFLAHISAAISTDLTRSHTFTLGPIQIWWMTFGICALPFNTSWRIEENEKNSIEKTSAINSNQRQSTASPLLLILLTGALPGIFVLYSTPGTSEQLISRHKKQVKPLTSVPVVEGSDGSHIQDGIIPGEIGVLLASAQSNPQS